ncbi:VOC family protein [Natrinema ejinorense]|uniref:Glyoxalase n=1 Tax=Natrinema ejinorense TaxID=373386 RepID=A0A2A5QTA5_9EURY|nr:VOC family protein [Natrinema ejinorense]PCR90035.1 glyoxalase [Natrinema ejinorense]
MSRSPTLPAGTRLGRTALRVADTGPMIEFYRDVVGLSVATRTEIGATLGVDGTPLLVLEAAPDTEPRGDREAGLYHNAFRLPSRPALGAALERIRDCWTLEGASDHGVSEALYCTDPEGNGVELYRDRPRDAWPRADDGTLRATGGPLDLAALAAAADDATTGNGSQLAPDGTTVGHVHLEVSSLEAARSFYAETVGFDVSMSYAPGSLFFATGGYHHHVGVNRWNERSTPTDGLGLGWFELLVPDAEAVDAIRERAADEATVIAEFEGGIELEDSDGIAVRVRPTA